MRKVYKYELKPDIEGVSITGPIVKILDVRAQDRRMYLWAEVDENIPVYTVNIQIVATGFSIIFNGYDYVGTIHMPPHVWHIYADGHALARMRR